MKVFLRTACTPHIMRNAVKVALVVGTVLNAVNQGAHVWRGEPISWWQVAMNYLVPYCVSTYSAVKNEMKHKGQS
ncbi:MAG: nitrate/nitrite transporter NrtS [Aquabacterium sp.]